MAASQIASATFNSGGVSFRSQPMTLLEALEVLKRPVAEVTPSPEMCLLCGFTPLHFKTFLAAHLRTHFPARACDLQTGLFGDLAGNLERAASVGCAEACAMVEWSDLDPRLGIRSLGSWRVADIPDIVESARRQADRLVHTIQRLAENVPVYVSTPTLPLPPIFTTPATRAQRGEWELRAIAASLGASVSSIPRTRVLAPQVVDEASPLGRRFDPKAEVNSGFPYSLEHASRLAELLATLIREAQPKKGLITDLDETLWAGILGEVGIDGISWKMPRGGHLQGLFQRFLDSLASAGVLLAAASKNDAALVQEAFGRSDMLLGRDALFPVEANWGPKSASVARILGRWNIGAADVIFVDDSPMEVAEVQLSFPEIECFVFPKDDPLAVWNLLKVLRERFGKNSVNREDELRLASVRSMAALKECMQSQEVSADEFLRNAGATLSFSLTNDSGDRRAIELINKTNQFNLNGRRISESELLKFLKAPGTFLLTASYEDKYGSLGEIAVLLAKITEPGLLNIESWVMSCRAFSRRIEHHCLRYLFDKLGINEIVFNYQPTPRNGPVHAFFAELLGTPPTPPVTLSRGIFEGSAPAAFHRIVEATLVS